MRKMNRGSFINVRCRSCWNFWQTVGLLVGIILFIMIGVFWSRICRIGALTAVSWWIRCCWLRCCCLSKGVLLWRRLIRCRRRGQTRLWWMCGKRGSCFIRRCWHLGSLMGDCRRFFICYWASRWAFRRFLIIWRLNVRKMWWHWLGRCLQGGFVGRQMWQRGCKSRRLSWLMRWLWWRRISVIRCCLDGCCIIILRWKRCCSDYAIIFVGSVCIVGRR